MGASVKTVTVVQGETSVAWVKIVGVEMEQGAQASVWNWMGEGREEP